MLNIVLYLLAGVGGLVALCAAVIGFDLWRMHREWKRNHREYEHQLKIRNLERTRIAVKIEEVASYFGTTCTEYRLLKRLATDLKKDDPFAVCVFDAKAIYDEYVSSLAPDP